MKEVLVIGQGLAGSIIGYRLLKSGISFDITDSPYDYSSSKVAAGIYNPVTGKRKVKTWLADELFPYLNTFYSEMEDFLQSQLVYSREIYKPFHDAADQNDVHSKSTTDELGQYINLDIDSNRYNGLIKNEMGGVGIRPSGNVDIKSLLSQLKTHFTEKGAYQENQFIPSQADIRNEKIIWNGKEYKQLVFCEGYKAIHNPLFSWLPFAVTKGHILKVRIPNFPTEHIVNKGFFILPLHGDEFLVGSSYELTDEEGVSENGKKQVLKKLNDLITVPYEILDIVAGIRPTVKDRRPMLGTHPEHKNVHIFNGLGTKGVTLGPYFSEKFMDYLFQGEKLPKEVNIERYFSLFYNSAQ